MNSFEIPTSAKKDDKKESDKEELSEKERELEKIRKEIDEAGDAEGKGVDEKIKEISVALNAVGMHTSQSCEGHCDEKEKGLIYPWVQINAPDEPEYRFNNQKEIFAEVAEKYSINQEQVEKMHNMKAYWEAHKKAELNGETKEYQQWNKQNEVLLNKMIEYLKEFYDNKDYSGDEQIHIENTIEGAFRIFCSTSDEFDPRLFWDDLDENQKKIAKENLSKHQAEMDRFASMVESANRDCHETEARGMKTVLSKQ